MAPFVRETTGGQRTEDKGRSMFCPARQFVFIKSAEVDKICPDKLILALTCRLLSKYVREVMKIFIPEFAVFTAKIGALGIKLTLIPSTVFRKGAVSLLIL